MSAHYPIVYPYYGDLGNEMGNDPLFCYEFTKYLPKLRPNG